MPLRPEGTIGRPLRGVEPRRVVLIRLQAFGDAAATLPVVAALRDRYPACRLDVVTGPATAPLFEARADVDDVLTLDARSARARRLADALRLGGRLRRPRADAVIDLQRSRLSRFLTLLARPRGWVAFDRFAPLPGLSRYLDAVDHVGLGRLEPVYAARPKPSCAAKARALLASAGRDPSRPLVCLNPAGGWPTKQWPLERYAELGARLAGELGAQIVILGEGAARARLEELSRRLAGCVLDFVGRTTPDVAMALVAEADLVVSDDSGLMHLGWAQGVPAIALFGASRAAWSRAVGPRSTGFYSEDLACGACMQPVCARGDLLCLDRVGVEDVMGKAREILRG
jgi:lipopolysaccharide heptosyltransferase II